MLSSQDFSAFFTLSAFSENTVDSSGNSELGFVTNFAY